MFIVPTHETTHEQERTGSTNAPAPTRRGKLRARVSSVNYEDGAKLLSPKGNERGNGLGSLNAAGGAATLQTVGSSRKDSDGKQDMLGRQTAGQLVNYMPPTDYINVRISQALKKCQARGAMQTALKASLGQYVTGYQALIKESRDWQNGITADLFQEFRDEMHQNSGIARFVMDLIVGGMTAAVFATVGGLAGPIAAVVYAACLNAIARENNNIKVDGLFKNSTETSTLVQELVASFQDDSIKNLVGTSVDWIAYGERAFGSLANDEKDLTNFLEALGKGGTSERRILKPHVNNAIAQVEDAHKAMKQAVEGLERASKYVTETGGEGLRQAKEIFELWRFQRHYGQDNSKLGWSSDPRSQTVAKVFYHPITKTFHDMDNRMWVTPSPMLLAKGEQAAKQTDREISSGEIEKLWTDFELEVVLNSRQGHEPGPAMKFDDKWNLKNLRKASKSGSSWSNLEMSGQRTPSDSKSRYVRLFTYVGYARGRGHEMRPISADPFHVIRNEEGQAAQWDLNAPMPVLNQYLKSVSYVANNVADQNIWGPSGKEVAPPDFMEPVPKG